MNVVDGGAPAPENENEKKQKKKSSKHGGAGSTTRFELPGGVLVLVEPSHAIPLLSIVVTTRSGGTSDPPGKEGLYRATLRMLRRGSEGLGSEEIEATLDRLGSEISVDVGASNATVYAQVIGRNVEAFVDLFARLLGAPTFPEDELARLRREIHAELLEVRDNDRALAQRAFRRGLYGDHPYARSSVGTLASVERLSVEDARALHAAHLRKGNLVIGFAGDVTPEKAREYAERLVARLPDGPPHPDTVPEPTMVPGRRLVLVDKPERTQTQILIGSLGTSPHDEDHVALSVANAVFGGTFTSRLMREVRSKRGWSYGASARLGVDRHRSSFAMWTFPAANDAADCMALELKLLEELVASGITARELAFIKRYLVRSYAFEIDTAAKRLHQALDVELLGLPADYYTGYLDHVEAVTLEAANAALARRLGTKDLLAVVVGTAGTILDKVTAALPEAIQVDVRAFDKDD